MAAGSIMDSLARPQRLRISSANRSLICRYWGCLLVLPMNRVRRGPSSFVADAHSPMGIRSKSYSLSRSSPSVMTRFVRRVSHSAAISPCQFSRRACRIYSVGNVPKNPGGHSKLSRPGYVNSTSPRASSVVSRPPLVANSLPKSCFACSFTALALASHSSCFQLDAR